MAGSVRGIIIEFEGRNSGIVKSLKEIDKNLSETERQLKQVDRSLKLDPQNVDLLATRQNLLTTAIQQTKEKLDLEQNAARDAGQALADGTISANEYNALQAGVAETTGKLAQLTDAAETNSISLRDIGAAALDLAGNLGGGLLNAIDLASQAMYEGFAMAAGAVWDASQAIGEAIVDITSQAVSGYGELEQFEGGIEKLYGEDAASVISNANDAFMTTGQSAADYMETVTSFSASLINSLGGDTEEAANIADIAMRAMADNAATFGSDMGSLTNVLKNLARGQYNTLDNLNLGFAGTQQGMIDLINASGTLETQIDSLDDVSFDQMILAIQAVQENMGIAGTAANEAFETIEGSIGATQTAWENFVTGLADPNSDIGQLIDNVVISGEAAIRNLVPTITRALGNISSALPQIINRVKNELPPLIREFLPDITAAVSDLIGVLASELPEMIGIIEEILPDIMESIGTILSEDNIDIILDAIFDIIDGIVGLIDENLEEFVTAAIDIISALARGLGEHMSELIPMVVEIITTLITELTKEDNLNDMVDAAIELIGGIVTGIGESLPDIIEAVGGVVDNILSGFQDGSLIDDLTYFGQTIIHALVQGIADEYPNLAASIQGIADLIGQVAGATGSFFNGTLITDIADSLNGNSPDYMLSYEERTANRQANAYQNNRTATTTTTTTQTQTPNAPFMPTNTNVNVYLDSSRVATAVSTNNQSVNLRSGGI